MDEWKEKRIDDKERNRKVRRRNAHTTIRIPPTKHP